MIVVDLATAAHDEAWRLTGARAHIAVSRPFVADGPLVGIVRRHRVRMALGRRMLLLFRCAYQDAAGRLVQSTLVAITVALRGNGFDGRRAQWSDASLLARVDDECCVWDAAAQHAIASNHRAVRPSFQPGLFDRRAHRVHSALERDAADFAARLTTRIVAVERAGALTRRSPQLLLALIPRDAARV